MKSTRIKQWRQYLVFWAVAGVAVLFLAIPAKAKDTDIYKINTKQNCYILMDSSGSMGFGVYEYSIDYGAMFDYLISLNDTAPLPKNTYIWDTINNSSYFYHNHQPMQKIYLWKGAIGVTIAHVDGSDVAFTGDAADPNYLWYMNALVDTHTVIDANGNITGDGSAAARLTVDGSGYILFDGVRLPLGMSIKLHDYKTLLNGTVVDEGFGGLLNAPGYYFSGYEGVAVGSRDIAESGDTNIYFFVTGNWVNMQSMYNLHYTTNNPTPTGAQNGDAAWQFEPFPTTPESWTEVPLNTVYDATTNPTPPRWPNSGNYANNLTESATARSITHAGAQKMQVHFSAFNVQGNSNANTFTRDYVKIYDQTGAVIVQYDNDNRPTTGDGWSPVLTGDTATVKLYSNASTVATGYVIDKIRVVYLVDAGGASQYLMQNRLDVAKDAMLYVVDAFRGKMNWGFASFGNNETGAQIGPFLNPTDNDDANRAAIVSQVNNVTASGGTPLMEALQDIWEQGYSGRKNVLANLLCRKNYIITVSDGFPSADDDKSRITGVTFADWDGDGWTQDPYQYANPNPDYYDDVAHWLYTHSWLDNSLVTDPANSYVNVMTHQVAFGANHPLLKDAAEESGGEYITAYNKEQLIAAFYSLALQMSEAISFTAPVVSVDSANKIQSGDDLYMGVFMPEDPGYWVGNLKKFKLGDGSAARPNLWMIYDGANSEAVDSSGQFADNTAAIWGDDNDINDHDNFGAADVREDGAGEVLTERVNADFLSGSFWERPIYTYIGGLLVKFDSNNVTKEDLNVATDADRDKLVNFVYGYTHDADASGNPVATRDWVLGAIVHSRPLVVDYYDPNNLAVLLHRYVVVGANDGMLHIFNDTDGSEAFAFIPTDILPKLKETAAAQGTLADTMDGFMSLYRRDKNPKYLLFGERRGGNRLWNLDITNSNPLLWTVKWQYSNAEISQTWSEPQVAAIPTAVNQTTGEITFKEVLVFTGGYDAKEDNFPEPFDDLDNNGTPYKSNGTLDTAEWKSSDAAQDTFNNGQYDRYNPDKDDSGRGIFVVDIDNPATSTTGALPFSVTYGAADLTTGLTQTLSGMKFCFPATPSLVTLTYKYSYVDTNGVTHAVNNDKNLQVTYASDIYGNIYKVTWNFKVSNSAVAPAPPNWQVTQRGWQVTKVFAANPGSLSGSGTFKQGVNLTDTGRKTFYSPAVSWGGSGSYFDAHNYHYDNVTFSGIKALATLFVGTGDREHPGYTMIRDRMYAIYDDSTLSTAQTNTTDNNGNPITVANASGAALTFPVAVSTVPYTEDNLLNLSCDELDVDTQVNSLPGQTALNAIADPADREGKLKQALQEILFDDATYLNTLSYLEEGAAHENDAKGWYIILADQGDATACSHCTYASGYGTGLHTAEKILSKPSLFYGTIYFTSYQPGTTDPCNPQGNGFVYALNYLDGTSVLNLNQGNDTLGNETAEVSDRSYKYSHIYGIPSGFNIITRSGEAGAMASMGGKIVGPGTPGGPGGPPYKIPSPGAGLELYYWYEGNTNQ